MADNPPRAALAGVFEHPRTVLFGDCDPANIVYYPRFFGFFHDAMEAWLTEHLAYNYAESIHTLGVGFPAVHTEADFRAPCRHGEAIVVGVRLAAIGGRSFSLAYRVWGAADRDDVRLQGKTVCAVMDLRQGTGISLPLGLRAHLEAFGVSQWSSP